MLKFYELFACTGLVVLVWKLWLDSLFSCCLNCIVYIVKLFQAFFGMNGFLEKVMLYCCVILARLVKTFDRGLLLLLKIWYFMLLCVWTIYFISFCVFVFVCLPLCVFSEHVYLQWSLCKQTFPDEIIKLDTSVRTLDLTHNRIDKWFSILLLYLPYILFKMSSL